MSGLVVTDIKSGKSDSFAKLSADDPVLGGSKMQLPVYGHAARQVLGRPEAEGRRFGQVHDQQR